MPSSILPTPLLPQADARLPLADEIANARDRAIYSAAAEAAALATVLQREVNNETAEFQWVARGALARIEALCAAVCILQDETSLETISEEYGIVFGEKLEAQHA